MSAWRKTSSACPDRVAAGRLTRNPRPLQLVQLGGDGRPVEGALDRLLPEHPPDDCRLLQDLLLGNRERVDAGGQQRLERVRQRARALLLQVEDQFLQEQRVALRSGQDLPAELGWQPAAGRQAVQEPLAVPIGQRSQGDRGGALQARAEARTGLGQLRARRRDHQQRTGRAGDHQFEHLQQPVVRPVEVLDDEQRRAGGGAGGREPGPGPRQLVGHRLRLDVVERAAGQADAGGGGEGEDGGVQVDGALRRPEDRAQAVAEPRLGRGRRVGQRDAAELPQHLAERRVGDAWTRGQATPPQDQRARMPRGHRRDRLPDHAALADPGGAEHREQPRQPALDDLVEQVAHHAQLGVAADHRALQPRRSRRVVHLPGHSAGTGFQAGEPHRLLVPEAGASDPADPLGGQDRARLRRLAQAGGGVQRLTGDLARAGAVARRGDHLAGGHAHPHRQRRAVQDLQPRSQAPDRVVLVDPWDAKHGHGRAADQPLGGAAPRPQHLAHQRRPMLQLQAGTFGIPAGRRGGGVHQHSGDELALLHPRRGRRGRGGRAGRLGGGREAAGGDLLVQPACLRAGLHAQLLGQPLLQLPVAAHGEVALPGQRVRPNQTGGGRLVERVHGDQPLQRPRRAAEVATGLQLGRPLQQQPAEARPELLTVLLGPGLEPILGQQLPAVQVDRRGQVPGLRRRLECLDVHPQPLRAKLEHLLAQPQVLGRQRLAGEVDGLAQVGRGRVRRQLGPEQVHELLAVQAVRRGQRKQLHDRLRLVPAPGLVRDRPRVEPDAKAAQQPDPHLGGHRPPSCRRQFWPTWASPVAGVPWRGTVWERRRR
jgi:hypothetical protein